MITEDQYSGMLMSFKSLQKERDQLALELEKTKKGLASVIKDAEYLTERLKEETGEKWALRREIEAGNKTVIPIMIQITFFTIKGDGEEEQVEAAKMHQTPAVGETIWLSPDKTAWKVVDVAHWVSTNHENHHAAVYLELIP
jgi:hypothetical protein